LLSLGQSVAAAHGEIIADWMTRDGFVKEFCAVYSA
jgi:hypothetical protein